MKNRVLLSFLLLCLCGAGLTQEKKRLRDWGVEIGILKPGICNAITDVAGVMVGHCTIIEGDGIRTGVTAVLPHAGNIFQSKVPAAVFVGNGFGKLAGTTQIQELGNIESPIILTNTLNVAAGIEGCIDYTFSFADNNRVMSVNGVVGETNDGGLNDIRARKVTKEDVLQAIRSAAGGRVKEGNVGAGTGTVAFGFKGGIGTASRVLPTSLGGYTVGVIVQTNFGGVLEINGAPVGVELGRYSFKNQIESADGSCMIVVATDAPLDARNLYRLAKRAFMGLAKTGGIASNGSGDYVIAFSTDKSVRVAHNSDEKFDFMNVLRNDEVSPLFLAAIEATEEAIINSLFAAQTMTGNNQYRVEALPVDQTMEILRKYGKVIQ
ncbi:MAG: P1 family peptidase [Prevotellaceae bacterium]|nr:P1 family peptidase [Prevotellaceae bacterium]